MAGTPSKLPFTQLFSPSMTGNTPHDAELKCSLLDDVFTIIDMEKMYLLLYKIPFKKVLA